MYLPNRTSTPKTPPLKRLRVGRKLRKQLTEAVNTPVVNDRRDHPFGDMLRELRISAGAPNRYKFAQTLGMTDQTLQKLETLPHRSGSKPMIKLLEAFGLALTLEVPGLDSDFGYPTLHEAFFAIRCRNSDLTQRVLSDRANVARTTIQSFESGKPIKLSVLMKLLDILGARVLVVPADQILLGITPTGISENEVLETTASSVDADDLDHRPLQIDRYAPSLADILKGGRPSPEAPMDEAKAERIKRANVKRAPWYWDGTRRRWPTNMTG